MTNPLKNRHDTKQISKLCERLKLADVDVMTENRVTQLLLEAMNEEDFKKVSAIIEKLNAIKNPKDLPNLTKAIEQAEAELNKYTGGGPITAAITKLKGLVGIDNPIVKITTFANALEKGFSQIPQILKNNGIDTTKLKPEDLNKTLGAILGRVPKSVPAAKSPTKTGAVSDKELGNTKFSSATEGHDLQEAEDTSPDAKINRIIDQFRKALSPSGIFGSFKKVPYIDSAVLAKELVGAPLSAFSAAGKTINKGVKSSEVASDIKDVISGGGGTETKASGQAEPSKSTAQTTQPTGTENPIVTDNSKPVGEVPAEPRGGGAETKGIDVKQGVAKVAKGSGIDGASVTSVLRYLINAGLLDKSKLASH